jgi:hypothetical protein
MAVTISGNRFLVDGKPRRLAGNHTWDVVQPVAGNRTPIDRLTGNFTRLWTIETKAFVNNRPPFSGVNPGLIRVKGGPWKQDLSLNPRFYRRMERAVAAADERDMVTGVVLFEGSIPDLFPRAWEFHPFRGHGPKTHHDVHTQGPWNKYQKAHVRRMVRTLEGYDNVIYEVGNELTKPSIGWFQRWVVGLVKRWTDKPVGVSYARAVHPSGGQQWMRTTGADWIAPGGPAPVAGFTGPQVLDTDHSWALRSNVPGLQAAARAGRPIWLMDGLRGTMLRNIDSLGPDRVFIASLVDQ